METWLIETWKFYNYFSIWNLIVCVNSLRTFISFWFLVRKSAHIRTLTTCMCVKLAFCKCNIDEFVNKVFSRKIYVEHCLRIVRVWVNIMRPVGDVCPPRGDYQPTWHSSLGFDISFHIQRIVTDFISDKCYNES